MLGNIILLCVPVLLSVIGAVCSGKDRKALFCTVFAVIVFIIADMPGITGTVPSNAEGVRLTALQPIISSIPYDALGTVAAPPAYLLILKLCSEFTADISLFLTVIAVLQSVLAAAFVYSRCSSPYIGALVFTAGFMLSVYVGSAFFIAALICCFASEYVEEHRFFRFAALIIAAACFDISAVMLLPLYIITLISDARIAAVVSAAVASLAAIYYDMTDSAFLYIGCCEQSFPLVTIPCASVACAAALLCILMRDMIANRNERFVPLVPQIVCGAAFSVAGIFHEKFFPISVFMLMPSAVVLAPEVTAISEKFVAILFPDKKTVARLAADAVGYAALIGIYAYIVFGNCYGSEMFGKALFGEVGA